MAFGARCMRPNGSMSDPVAARRALLARDMNTLGIELRASHRLSGCDSTTRCATRACEECSVMSCATSAELARLPFT
jgi:hypothetical protein